MKASEYAVLADDRETRSELSGFSWLKFVDVGVSWKQIDHPLFVLATASQLERVSPIVRMANRRQKLKGLFIRTDVSSLLLPQFLHRADLRVLRNTLAHSDSALPKRVIQAWHYGMQDALIATAEVIDDRLVLVTCSFRTLEVDFDDVKPLQTIPVEARASFEISSEGSYIHWPTADVHLDVDSIRYCLDEDWRLKQDTLRLSEDRRLGHAIQQLRSARGLRQADISGLSDRQVRRIESGARATVSGLRHLAAAHDLSLQEYLRTLSETLQRKSAN